MHAITYAQETLRSIAANPLESRFARCASWEECPPIFRGDYRNVPIGHVAAQALADDRTVHLPTPYVHLGYFAANPDLLATYPISTGTAFAGTRREARWRGLCEVAERDAIMLFWLTRRGFRSILATYPTPWATLTTRLAHLRDAGLTFRLLDITTDFRVPTVLATVSGDAYPFTTVGASCHVNPLWACCKALDEAVSVRYSLRHPRWAKPAPSFVDFRWVRRLEDHMRLYGHWPSAPPLAFMDDAPSVSLGEFLNVDTMKEPTTDEELKKLSRALLYELGLTVIACDFEDPDVSPLGYVSKVVVPEMLPLSQDHSARWLSTDRLRRRLQHGDEDVNEFPHPFS